MSDDTVDRRSFLHRAGKLAALSGFVVMAGLPSGCSPQSEEADTKAGADPDPSAGADVQQPDSPTAGTEDPCGDVSGLSEEDLSDRADISYVAATPYPEKRCDNCELWVAPENGSPCGGCDVLAGPIHPEGYCDIWVPA